MINWNGHDPENTVVHCPTYTSAKRILQIADDAGETWGNGKSYLSEPNWDKYGSETCYCFGKQSYCNKAYFESFGYIVVSAEDFINWNKPVPEDTSVEIGTGDDPVNHPSHYTSGKVECIDALEAAIMNLTGIEAVCTANAIKYLWRWKQKNGVEDLKKAKWYIDKLIDHNNLS